MFAITECVGKAYLELSELDTAEEVFRGILADDNDNEEAMSMLARIKKQKQLSSETQKALWGGKLGGAAPSSSSPPKPSMNELPTPNSLVFSWETCKNFFDENLEYIAAAFFATVGVVVFYHVCDNILNKMPSRS